MQFAEADKVDQPNHASTIRTGKLVVNLETRRVTVDGQAVHLTDMEYGVLELLNLRKGSTSTKEMFLAHLYRGRYEPKLKIIDVFVCKLRKKLTRVTGGSHYIDTVWGRGYVLRDPATPGDGCGCLPDQGVISDRPFDAEALES
jgi:two-component system cell cycle response regulator CtrA